MLINKIKHKIKLILLNTVQKAMREEAQNHHPNNQKLWFKKFGANSFFWGDTHYISGHNQIEIGENVHINNNSYIVAEGGLSIGDNTHISRNLTLYTRNHDYKGQFIPYDYKFIYKPVSIGKNVWIGMNVSIAPGTIIGDGCIIGIGSVVSGTVPALSIVGLPKCQVIGVRDEKHYQYREQNKLYGGANGFYYNWSNQKHLENEGDHYYGSRSVSEILLYKDYKVVRKTYYQTDEGKEAYRNELLAYKRFQKYKWCPRLIDFNGNSITIECFDASQRLDKIIQPNANLLKRQVIEFLFDIFSEGFSHRDFHIRNIFVVNNQIRVIDYESINPHNNSIGFLESYDLTGNNMEHPFNMGGIFLFHSSPNSIGSLLGISSIKEISQIISAKLKEEAFQSSITFRSNKHEDKRHSLRFKKIYSSFNLKNFKVTPEESQRNTKVRFRNFRILESEIIGKNILDIGSNIGGTLLNLADFKPAYMQGLEIDEDKVVFSRRLAVFNDIKADFTVFDIEKREFQKLKKDKFEVVFCLAIIEHLIDKQSLFDLISKVQPEVLYFEGNGNTDRNLVETSLKNIGFQYVEYIGFSNDESNRENNVRPMWIAKK